MRADASLIGIRDMADRQPTSVLFSVNEPDVAQRRFHAFGGQSSELGRLPAGYRLHGPKANHKENMRTAMAITVAELSDREEIRQVMYKFFHATDRRDASNAILRRLFII
jgi:hypothetical protein